jgi:hypothetical protein
MEADWSAEIGPDLPRISVPWEGFLDLRGAPALAMSLPEAANFRPLASALIRLNGGHSPVFTSKCDVWAIPNSEIDPDEFGAQPKTSQTALASYIDMLLRDAASFASFAVHETLVKQITHRLRAIPLADCRVDLVLRPADRDDTEGYGITLYAVGCGADEEAARASWESVLAAAVLATIEQAS